MFYKGPASCFCDIWAEARFQRWCCRLRSGPNSLLRLVLHRVPRLPSAGPAFSLSLYAEARLSRPNLLVRLPSSPTCGAGVSVLHSELDKTRGAAHPVSTDPDLPVRRHWESLIVSFEERPCTRFLAGGQLWNPPLPVSTWGHIDESSRCFGIPSRSTTGKLINQCGA